LDNLDLLREIRRFDRDRDFAPAAPPAGGPEAAREGFPKDRNSFSGGRKW
jgi:hypothetical protein